MSEIKALEKLRAAGRNMAKGRNLENHEECNLLLVIADEIQGEVDERFMALPLDADGVPIHVGDEIVCSYGVDEVEGVHPERIFLLHENEWLCVQAQYKRHYRPRTLEDVLNDFGRKFAENYHYPNAEGLVDETADEIRELMKEGGDD